ncbi:MAG TPA: flagellar protein FlgN [Steroidobacteraceae bacterium]|nr:flagellar protein FlgN [Steroidobacteraceae bacterium]
MDASACREHIEQLLTQETNELARLQTLLDREHELILANNIEELDRAGDVRQACVGELARIEDERRSLCRMHNLPADAMGLERMMKWCDPSRSLQRLWSDCAERATACRAANDRNGALVTARLKKVEGLLDVLTGRATQPKVYGRQGGYQSSGVAPRVLVTV